MALMFVAFQENLEGAAEVGGGPFYLDGAAAGMYLGDREIVLSGKFFDFFDDCGIGAVARGELFARDGGAASSGKWRAGFGFEEDGDFDDCVRELLIADSDADRPGVRFL